MRFIRSVIAILINSPNPWAGALADENGPAPARLCAGGWRTRNGSSPEVIRRNAPAPDQARRGWWHPVIKPQGAIDGQSSGAALAVVVIKVHLPPAGWSPSSISQASLAAHFNGRNKLASQRLAPPAQPFELPACVRGSGSRAGSGTFSGASSLSIKQPFPRLLSPAHRWHRLRARRSNSPQR